MAHRPFGLSVFLEASTISLVVLWICSALDSPAFARGEAHQTKIEAVANIDDAKNSLVKLEYRETGAHFSEVFMVSKFDWGVRERRCGSGL